MRLRVNNPRPACAALQLHQGEKAIKTILSALVALSLIAGVANTASALDAKSFYEQFDRSHYAKAHWTAGSGATRGLE